MLTVYTHPNPASLCHAPLERFTYGLEHAGHEPEHLQGAYRLGRDFESTLEESGGAAANGMSRFLLGAGAR